MLESYAATRYLVPLREGGSLPAVLDTDGGGLFVAKFRGAGQGARALVAELIVGLIARETELPVPDVALIELDESFARTEKDPEIQDILRASHGVNIGLRYLEGAFNYDPLAVASVDATLASRIVWLDAFTSNIDRTARNPNMLLWRDSLWLIDHGAALYFHHNWPSVDDASAQAPFTAIGSHMLLEQAAELEAADEYMSSRITGELIRSILDAVPGELLMDAPAGTTPPFESAEDNREAYCRYFEKRLETPRLFVDAAHAQRETRMKARPQQQGYRK